MPTQDFVTVEVNDQRVETWTEYSIDSDLMQPADGFHMSVSLPGPLTRDGVRERDRVRELLSEGSTIKVYVGADVTGANHNRALQMVGIIDTQAIDADREAGTVIEIEGRDLAAHLVDSSAPLNLLSTGTLFVDVVRAAVAPWGIEVVADHTASRDILTGRSSTVSAARLAAEEARAFGIPPEQYSRSMRRRAERTQTPADELAGVTPSEHARRNRSNGLAPGDVERITLQQAKPSPGEEVWSFIDRHARRLGLMAWMTATGKLVLASPHYDQAPLYRFVRRYQEDARDPNTILTGRRVQNAGDRYSKATVYGHASGSDVARTNIVASVENTTLPYPRPLIIHDNGIRSIEHAQRRAKRELQRREANADTLICNCVGHGLGHYLFAIDTIAEVVDEVTGARGRWYLTKRTFTKSKAAGTLSQLHLVPDGAIVL